MNSFDQGQPIDSGSNPNYNQAHVALGMGSGVGTGRVLDPNGLNMGSAGGINGNSSGNGRIGGDGLLPSRTHYRLSRIEILQGMANRFVHSTFYLYFYASMAVASLLTVFLSLFQDCPGSLFYGLELGINLVLIAEVGVRMGAFGKQFWKSTFNIIDLCLVLLCAITLLVIFFSHDCSPYRRGDPNSNPEDPSLGKGKGRGGKSEELLDSLLLIGRNAAQMIRLLSVVRRSSNSVTHRVSNIDIDIDVDSRLARAERDRELSFSLDIDLEDEGARVRDRMADGGDERARRKRDEWRNSKGGIGNGNGKRGEQEPLFEQDEEEDEDDEL